MVASYVVHTASEVHLINVLTWEAQVVAPSPHFQQAFTSASIEDFSILPRSHSRSPAMDRVMARAAP